MGVTVGQVTAMTVITPIKPGMAGKLRQVLQGIQAAPNSLIQKINTIHYARWAIIDNDTRLLFTSTFDGTGEQYLGDFVNMIPEGLDQIWNNCVGYPGARSEAFKAYVREHEVNADVFYAAYPNTTVKQVLDAIRLQGTQPG